MQPLEHCSFYIEQRRNSFSMLWPIRKNDFLWFGIEKSLKLKESMPLTSWLLNLSQIPGLQCHKLVCCIWPDRAELTSSSNHKWCLLKVCVKICSSVMVLMRKIYPVTLIGLKSSCFSPKNHAAVVNMMPVPRWVTVKMIESDKRTYFA